MTTRDWDGATYDRISAPQEEWARVTLDRLELAGDETVLDAGCGSGRVTRLLARPPAARARPGGGRRARRWSTQATAALGDRATVWRSDLVALEVAEPVDAVFSNAVFHWVPDHDALFARLHAALRPGGQLVAQCGGRGNIERFHGLAREVAAQEPYAEHLGGWEGPWNFAGAEETRERWRRRASREVQTWLEESPMGPPEPENFLRVVCLGHHLEALPEDLRAPYTRAVLERCGDPVELDYVRLNILARA